MFEQDWDQMKIKKLRRLPSSLLISKSGKTKIDAKFQAAGEAYTAKILTYSRLKRGNNYRHVILLAVSEFVSNWTILRVGGHAKSCCCGMLKRTLDFRLK